MLTEDEKERAARRLRTTLSEDRLKECVESRVAHILSAFDKKHFTLDDRRECKEHLLVLQNLILDLKKQQKPRGWSS